MNDCVIVLWDIIVLGFIARWKYWCDPSVVVDVKIRPFHLRLPDKLYSYSCKGIYKSLQDNCEMALELF